MSQGHSNSTLHKQQKLLTILLAVVAAVEWAARIAHMAAGLAYTFNNQDQFC